MKRLFYVLIAHLVRWTSRCMFSRIEIRGMDRVPWEKPCLVSPNHPNAFLDALLIGAFAPTSMSYLSRADIFGTRFDWFLDALQMVPVYRRRDGFETLSRNRQIFAEQREKLRQGQSLLIFSEARHAHTYYLRPLSKGSSRFALETQAAIDREVMVVPVGLNYYHLTRPGFKVSLVFGDPLPVSAYMERYRDQKAKGIRVLREDLTGAMKACLLVPDETDDYRERVDCINRKNEGLSFPEMKRALQTPEILETKGVPRSGFLALARWISLLNAGPLWIMKTLMRWVEDPVFALSLKFAVGMLALPLWWAAVFGVVAVTVSPTAGVLVVSLVAGTMGLRILLIRYANPPHPIDSSDAKKAEPH